MAATEIAPIATGRFGRVRQLVKRTAIVRIVILVLALRFALGLLAIASLAVDPGNGGGGDWNNLLLPPDAPGADWIAPWQRWDALWYQKIAQDGYGVEDGSLAFFPLFPLLMHFAGLALGGNMALGGLVISTLALVFALVMLRLLVAHDVDARAADNTILYVGLFPTAFFFLAPFTEATFLACAVAAIYGARTGRWWLAGAAGLLGGVTRAQGVMVALPLAFEWLRQGRWRSAGGWMAGSAVALPVVGLAGFMAYKVALTGGQPLGELRSYWGFLTVPPWQLVADSWQYTASHGDWSEALNLATLGLFTIGAFLMIGKLPYSYFLYVIPQLALLLTREMWFSPAMSVSRYVLVLFPVFVYLGEAIRSRGLRFAVLAVFVLLQLFYFYKLVHWGFVA